MADELRVVIKGDDQLTPTLLHVRVELDKTRQTIGGLSTETVAKSALMAGAIGAVGTAVVGLGASVVSTAISINNQLGAARIAFTTMLGSADAAEAHLKELAQFAATTPFEFPELVKASQRLNAMGFAAGEVIPLLTSIGNASAALGAGTEGVNRIVTALGQMQAKGKATAEEMMQLTEVGVPAWDMLAKKLNTDVSGAMEQVEKRTVSAQTVIAAFQEGSAARFGNMMEQQARTFAGAMTNIQDAAQMAIAQGFKPLFEVLTDVTVAVADATPGWAAWATAVEQASARSAAALRQVPSVARGAAAAGGTVTGVLGGPEVAAAGGAASAALGGVGIDWSNVLIDAMVVGLGGGLPLVGAALVSGLAALDPQLRRAATDLGTDFERNVAAALLAESPSAEAAMGAVAERLVMEFKARGLSEEQARDAARSYMTAVADELERQRPGITAAAAGMGEAVAAGLDSSKGLVGAAAASLAETAGAALAASKGNVSAAVAEAIRVGTEAGFSESAQAALVAETLQQANAVKALTEALNTLTPAERAHYEVQLASSNAMTVLTQMRDAGKISAEQYTNALARGSVGLQQHTTATQAATTAAQAHTAALQTEAAAAAQIGQSRAGFGGGGSPEARGTESAADREVRAQIRANAWSTGDMIAQGLVAGVQANRQIVSDAVMDLGRQMLARMRQNLGIRSPSQVFADEVGTPIAEGVAAGITAGTGTLTTALDDAVRAAFRASGATWETFSAQYMPFIEGDIYQRRVNTAPQWFTQHPTLGGSATDWASFTDPQRQSFEREHMDTIADEAAARKTHTTALTELNQAWLSYGNVITAQTAVAQDATRAQANASTGLVQFTAGTDLATRHVSLVTNAMSFLEEHIVTVGDTIQDMQNEWNIAKANAAALRSGTTVIAGQTIGAGQTYGQIYGNTGTTSGGGSANPYSAYGLPIVSPITPGTLYGRDSGVTIINNTTVNASGVDALRDNSFWDQIVDQQVGPKMAKKRLI